MSHQCQNLLLRCMDFRLEKSISQWLNGQGLVGDTDIISIPGSCKVLAEDPTSCKAGFIMEGIALAHDKHGVKKIILTQHEDCGAYGGQSAFADPAAEKLKLLTDMAKVKDLLLSRYADLEVSMCWLKLVGDDWQLEEVV